MIFSFCDISHALRTPSVFEAPVINLDIDGCGTFVARAKSDWLIFLFRSMTARLRDISGFLFNFGSVFWAAYFWVMFAYAEQVICFFCAAR